MRTSEIRRQKAYIELASKHKDLSLEPRKNSLPKEERGVFFESMVVAIEGGGLLDILAHPNEQKHPRQRVLVVAHDNYANLVPYVEEDKYFFLKTVIPSPKATRDYLNQGDDDADKH